MYKFFGSIAVKIILVLMAMGGITMVAVVVANSVFKQTVSNLEQLNEVRLPALTVSGELIQYANELSTHSLSLTQATDRASLKATYDETVQLLDDLEATINRTGDAAETNLAPLHAEVAADLSDLTAARDDEFATLTVIRHFIKDLSARTEIIGGLVEERADDAVFNLAIGGEETTRSIGETLDDIVNVEVTLLQTIYELRAAANLASGVAMAITQTEDSAIRTILVDLSEAGIAEMREKLKQVEEVGFEGLDAGVIETAIDTFERATVAAGRFKPGLADDVLTNRRLVDTSLSELIDELVFALAIDSEVALDTNAGTIQGLLDGPVNQLSAMGHLRMLVWQYMSFGLETALAPDEPQLETAYQRFAGQAAQLSEAAGAIDGAPIPDIEGLIALSEREDGIYQARKHALKEQAAAREATERALYSVMEIVEMASSLGRASREEIAAESAALLSSATEARSQFRNIAIISNVFFVLALVFSFFWLIQPLTRLTKSTERLAAGGLDETVEFGRQSGEIRRMAEALKFFRDGLIEKQRMEAEEAERQENDRIAAKEAAEREQREREAEERKLREAECAEKEREAAIAAEKETLRQAAEQERQARMAEQELVVKSLAKGLKDLASGNLRVEIEVDFPGDYEQLRQDFNLAVSHLKDSISQIVESGITIDLSSQEISDASENLARRTEQAAGTLETTAASITELTASVQSSAQRAEQAMNEVRDAQNSADGGKEIVQSMVEAMQSIEGSSTKITQIISVIDDIAFQTNLLALNAGVEAARAGDSGRGFAVVASEVRALAQRSSEAAHEISSLIAVSSQQVKSGVDLAGKTDEALQKIDEAITVVAEQASEIASASKEQAGGISEINSSTLDLDRVTQQNAAMFEETTAASMKLRQEAQNLADAIAGFKLENGDSNVSSASHRKFDNWSAETDQQANFKDAG